MSLEQIKLAIVSYGNANFDIGQNTDPTREPELRRRLEEAREKLVKLTTNQHDSLRNLVIMLPSVQGVPPDRLKDRIGPAYSFVRWLDVKEAREALGMEV